MESEASFGWWLRRRRKALDLTQDALAERVGCSIATIRKIEADERRPSRQIAELLAEVLAIATGERAAFLKVARAELAVDRLGAPIPASGPAAPASSRPLPTGTVTFLFTDIEGSSRLWEQHKEIMPAALARHDAILSEAIEERGGVVFRTVGDAFCTAFARALDALAAALDAQRALRDAPWPASGPLRVRMALHTGLVELQAGNYLGQPLNRVARLLACGHGGQILLSRATEELVADHLPPELALRDLGVHHLRDLSRPEQVYQLVAGDLRSEFPPLALRDERAVRLPVPLTPLIGREAELAEVGRLLARAECRLLTLVGPGGIGKTRLAIAAAAEQGQAFRDGVYFVGLAPLSAPEFIVPAIAEALGFAFYSGMEPKAQLLNYVREKQLLLVLDNIEHLLDGAGLLSELLQHAPGLKLLATSRERLSLQGEWVLDLQGLPVPSAGQTDQLESYSAVTLFVESARRVRVGFALSERNRADVARVCQLVEGLPLGIELAATWVPALSCQEIGQQIERNIDFLAVAIRDLPERHRSIRAVFDQSWKLLLKEERQVLRRLSVFRGGFTHAAAEQVAGATLGLISALVSKSLLRRTETGRYDLHELVRQYSAEKLLESGEADAIRRRHATYYLALAEEAEPQLRSVGQGGWLARLEMERDNLRAVLAWAFGGGDGEMGLRLTGALVPFWYVRRYFSEGRTWLEAALAIPPVSGERLREWAVARTMTLTAAGLVASEQGHHPQAIALAEEALTLFRELGDRHGMAQVITLLGYIAFAWNDISRATALTEEALTLFRELDDRYGIAETLHQLGDIVREQGDYVRATALLEESLSVCRELGNKQEIALVLNGLGEVALYQGDFVRAARLYQEALSLLRELESKASIPWVLRNLGRVAYARGDFARAVVLLEEGLARFRELGHIGGLSGTLHLLGTAIDAQGDAVRAIALLREGLVVQQQRGVKYRVVESLERFALLAARQESPDRAARLLGAAEALRAAIGTPLPAGERPDYERTVAAARIQLDETVFAASWAEGRAMSLEEAITEALGLAIPRPPDNRSVR